MIEDMEKRTRQFIEVRDMIKHLEDEAKDKIKPWKAIQDELAGKIQEFMSVNNLQNLKTSSGTCYTSTRHTATLADPDIFMKYVIEHKAFDLLDRRANSTAVKEFIERTKALPPGCNISAITTLGVRRGAGSNNPE